MAVITISRQVGSGCRQIVEQVCQRLGYSYFDKNLLVREATRLGLSEQEIIDFSEESYKTRTLLENLFAPGARILARVPICRRDESGVEKKYIRHLDEIDAIHMIQTVLHAAYRRDNIVIVGRGGQVILQKKPDVLHVRLVAPLEARVRRLQEQEGWDAEKARQYALERDRATAEFLYRFFKVEWDDPTLYNLVIDTGQVDLSAAADQIIQAVERLPVRA